jgi:hypothetical protein
MAKTKKSNSPFLTNVTTKPVWGLALAASAIGIIFVVKSFAGGAGATYQLIANWTPRATNTVQAFSVHTDPNECRRSQAVCHSNGSLVDCSGTTGGGVGLLDKIMPKAYAGGAGPNVCPTTNSGGVGFIPKAYAGGAGENTVWLSDPNANNSSSNFTWFGPFITMSKNTIGAGNDGYRACFNLEDISLNSAQSRVYMDVVQDRGSTANGTSGKDSDGDDNGATSGSSGTSGGLVTLTSTTFNVASKQGFTRPCIPFNFQNSSAPAVQYRLRVLSGQVSIHDVQIERLQ